MQMIVSCVDELMSEKQKQSHEDYKIVNCGALFEFYYKFVRNH